MRAMWHITGGGQHHMGAMCALMELCELNRSRVYHMGAKHAMEAM
jgi:hypothetical protein